MEFSKANKRDLAGIKEIWLEQFSQDKDYINYIIPALYKLGDFYIIKKESSIVSTLCTLPIKYINREKNINLSGYYIYGVATKKSHEKKGYSSILLQNVEALFKSNNISFTILHPVNEQLAGFYIKRGYTIHINRQYFIFPTYFNQISNSKELCTVALYNHLNHSCNNYFKWDISMLEHIIESGEFSLYLSIQENKDTSLTYILLNPIDQELKSNYLTNALFLFPME